MKLILELDEKDIDFTFEESYRNNQIHFHQLERFHFKDDPQAYWKEADEVWFIERAVIQQSETESFELTPKRTRLK